jgi:hypothetical protein
MFVYLRTTCHQRVSSIFQRISGCAKWTQRVKNCNGVRTVVTVVAVVAVVDSVLHLPHHVREDVEVRNSLLDRLEPEVVADGAEVPSIAAVMMASPHPSTFNLRVQKSLETFVKARAKAHTACSRDTDIARRIDGPRAETVHCRIVCVATLHRRVCHSAHFFCN